MKKINKKIKILILIIIIILILLSIFSICIFRKHLIIKDMKNKLISHLGCDNYYVEELNYDADNILIEYYILDGKILEKHETDDQSYYRYYENGNEDLYVNYKGEKLGCLNFKNERKSKYIK